MMLQLADEIRGILAEKLNFLYGPDMGPVTLERLEPLLAKYWRRPEIPFRRERFSEKDVVLITYGDMIRNIDHPIRVLSDFAHVHLRDKISTIHVLPFFKYGADRGFSVVDYKQVDPAQGDWDDVIELKKNFRLMFDLVINHVSDKHLWFREFKKGKRKYLDYFIWYTQRSLPPQEQIGKVFRPRTTPLLTMYETSDGKKYLWTTFPLNQVDLNFKNPDVLLDMIDIMLFYVDKGADIIRLDAIAFVWKELGTSCVHLKQAHVIVQLLRTVLNAIAPNVSIITETNVPHKENIQYFGDGRDEAQMVYNFALPPLVVHAIYKEDATYLSKWARELATPSEETAFFNHLDSHDGIGILGARGVLPDNELEDLISRFRAAGGLVSSRKNRDGEETCYELNATWWSVVNLDSKEDLDTQIRRYLATRSVGLCLRGVPGVYLNGLVGALNDVATAIDTGNNRDINRRSFREAELLEEIEDADSRTHRIFHNYLNLIDKRVREKAFNPNSDQEILETNKSVFTVVRRSPDNDAVTALHNLSNRKQLARLDERLRCDLISQKSFGSEIDLGPYDILWLKDKPIDL